MSFGLFALDQVGGASRHQVAEIASGSPVRTAAPGTAPATGQPRHFIDQAARALTAPFRSLSSSWNQWPQQGFAAICGLLLYGLGLGYLIRYSRGLP